jgi:hypothetical protein
VIPFPAEAQMVYLPFLANPASGIAEAKTVDCGACCNNKFGPTGSLPSLSNGGSSTNTNVHCLYPIYTPVRKNLQQAYLKNFSDTSFWFSYNIGEPDRVGRDRVQKNDASMFPLIKLTLWYWKACLCQIFFCCEFSGNESKHKNQTETSNKCEYFAHTFS